MKSTHWEFEWNFDSSSNLPVLIRQVLCKVCLWDKLNIQYNVLFFRITSVLITISKVICKNESICYENLEIIKKFSNFLNEVLSNTCYRATIILPDSNICEWNSVYVTSEPNLTDHLVDPQTGIVEVSNITVIMLK